MLKNRFKKILVALDGSANSKSDVRMKQYHLQDGRRRSITGIYVLPGFTSEPTTKPVSYESMFQKSPGNSCQTPKPQPQDMG